MSADTAALLACPFCGSTDAVRLDDGDSWDFLPDGEPLTWAVVCDYNRGGCGGSGGFRDSQKDAIAAWNQAADRLAELEAESSRLQAGIQLYKADFEHGLNGLKHEYAKLEQDNARLRNGNTALIGALMDMVHQHFYHHHDGSLHHSFMSADEGAIEVLIDAGYAEEAPGGGYRLLWDKLAERKNALAAGGDQ